MNILAYIMIILLRNLVKYTTTVSQLKRLNSNPKNIKPWVTKGILKSIKRKNLLYKSYIKSPSIYKKKFATYRNKLNHLLRLSKKHYIDKKIKESENNNKETWKIINSLLNKSKGKNDYSTHYFLFFRQQYKGCRL